MGSDSTVDMIRMGIDRIELRVSIFCGISKEMADYDKTKR